MNSKIDITEVARLSGVSTATVSRVINNSPLVKTETRETVEKVLKSTNYRVNAAAKQLRTSKSYNIGMIYTNLMMNFYNTISKGVEDVAKKNGYNVFFCSSGDDPTEEEEYLSMLVEKGVDGIILSPTTYNVDKVQNIMSRGIPVCIFDRTIEGLETDSVMVDNRNGSRKATEFLLQQGYERIGFIAGPQKRSNGIARHLGCADAFREKERVIDEKYIRYGDFTFSSGYELVKDLFNSCDLDALFVANERMAGGALKWLMENKIRLKEDIGFVMWDDPFWTTLVQPNITAISQPMYTIGITVADLLLKRISNISYMEDNPIKITLETTFNIRESA